MANIFLQAEKLSTNNIATNTNVIFDNTILTDGNISYDGVTGVVTFNEVGVYQVNWWVATQSQNGGSGNIFAIRTSQNDDIEGTSATKTGEITGFALIDVTEAGVTMSLVNSSDYTVYAPTTLPVKAGISIVQEDVDESIGGGAIIPYASGIVAPLATVIGGLANVSAILGFGWSDTLVGVGGIIDLTLVSNTAFMVPRNGTITGISGFMSVAIGVSTTAEITVVGQLYQSTAPDNDFTAIPGATVTLLPSVTGLISVGDIATATVTGLNLPVTAGTRLLLVFTPTVTGGIDLATALAVYISGGVAIS